MYLIYETKSGFEFPLGVFDTIKEVAYFIGCNYIRLTVDLHNSDYCITKGYGVVRVA